MRERSRVGNWSSELQLLVPSEEFKVEAVILERSYREALLEDRSNAGALKDTQEAQEPGWTKESGAELSEAVQQCVGDGEEGVLRKVLSRNAN